MTDGERFPTYDAWRENKVREVGGAVVRKAEEAIDRQSGQALVRMTDEAKGGAAVQVREDMARRLESRGTHLRQGARKTFLMPRLPWRDYGETPEEPPA